jgi:triacylglycerol lipase
VKKGRQEEKRGQASFRLEGGAVTGLRAGKRGLSPFFFLPPLLLLLAACSAPEVVCAALADDLQKCGFPVTDLQCDTLAQSDLEQLSAQFGQRDCSGFATGAGAVDPRVCALGGWSCPGNPLPTPSEARPQFPIALVSGIDGSPLFDWHPRVAEALKAAGVEAHHIEVLPWATTPDRAADLWESLRSLKAHSPQGRFNLVCYAVGGLDCRYLVSPGGLFKDDAAQLAEVTATVASITTLSTPHRGTRVADAAKDALQSGTVSDVLQALVGNGTNVSVPDDAAVLKTLDGLSLDALEQFNAQVVDAPGLPYFSWAGISHVAGRSSATTEAQVRSGCASPDGQLLYFRHPETRDALNPLLWATVPFSFEARVDGRDEQSPSDGMVSVESAKWGLFEGCVPADHYDVIGEIGHSARDPQTGFDAPDLLVLIASLLAEGGL